MSGRKLVNLFHELLNESPKKLYKMWINSFSLCFSNDTDTLLGVREMPNHRPLHLGQTNSVPTIPKNVVLVKRKRMISLKKLNS